MSNFDLPGMRRMHWAQTVEEIAPVEVVDLEPWLDDDLACEGANHPHGTYGHTSSSPAEYRVVAPCCKRGVNQCASRVAVIVAREFTSCEPAHGGCGAVFDTAELRVVKI